MTYYENQRKSPEEREQEFIDEYGDMLLELYHKLPVKPNRKYETKMFSFIIQYEKKNDQHFLNRCFHHCEYWRIGPEEIVNDLNYLLHYTDSGKPIDERPSSYLIISWELTRKKDDSSLVKTKKLGEQMSENEFKKTIGQHFLVLYHGLGLPEDYECDNMSQRVHNRYHFEKLSDSEFLSLLYDHYKDKPYCVMASRLNRMELDEVAEQTYIKDGFILKFRESTPLVIEEKPVVKRIFSSRLRVQEKTGITAYLLMEIDVDKEEASSLKEWYAQEENKKKLYTYARCELNGSKRARNAGFTASTKFNSVIIGTDTVILYAELK